MLRELLGTHYDDDIARRLQLRHAGRPIHGLRAAFTQTPVSLNCMPNALHWYPGLWHAARPHHRVGVRACGSPGRIHTSPGVWLGLQAVGAPVNPSMAFMRQVHVGGAYATPINMTKNCIGLDLPADRSMSCSSDERLFSS